MILSDNLHKVAARVSESGLLPKLKHLVVQAASTVEAHPGVAVTASIGSSIVAVLQSAQEVVSTLIALVTSLAGLVVAIMALRGKLKGKDKE